MGLNVCEDWHGIPAKSAPLLWSNVIMLNYFLIIYIEQKVKMNKERKCSYRDNSN